MTATMVPIRGRARPPGGPLNLPPTARPARTSGPTDRDVFIASLLVRLAQYQPILFSTRRFRLGGIPFRCAARLRGARLAVIRVIVRVVTVVATRVQGHLIQHHADERRLQAL